MNKKEFAVLAAQIKTFYPREPIMQDDIGTEAWYEMLKDIPFPVAQAAVSKWISTNKWSPTIAELREICAKIQHGEQEDWSAAWDKVIKLIHKYGYMREGKIMAELDPVTRECVEILCLQSIAASDEKDNAFRRKEFKELYETRTSRIETAHQIPAALHERIKGLRLPDEARGVKMIHE